MYNLPCYICMLSLLLFQSDNSRDQLMLYVLLYLTLNKCYVMLCYAMLYRAVPCRVVSCRVVSCRVMTCRVMSCHVMSCLSCGVWHFSIHSSRNWLWRYRYFVLIYDMPNMPGQQQPFPTATSCLWTNWILWSRKWHSPSNSYRCMKTISPLGLR